MSSPVVALKTHVTRALRALKGHHYRWRDVVRGAFRDLTSRARRLPPVERVLLIVFVIAAIALLSTCVRSARVTPAAITDIRMGDRVQVSHDGRPSAICSVGPSVVYRGAKGFLLAGHCGRRGDLVSFDTPQGDVLVGVIEDATQDVATGKYSDAAVVRLRDARVSPRVGHGVIPYRTVSVSEISQRNPSDAVRVCAEGATSGIRCGIFHGLDPDTGLVRIGVPSLHGDSGGVAYVSAGGRAEILGLVVRSFLSTDGESGTLVMPLDRVFDQYHGLKALLDVG